MRITHRGLFVAGALAAAGAPSLQAEPALEYTVGVELEHRNLPLTGPHQAGDCVEFLPHQLR